jgi:hypothetical protein
METRPAIAWRVLQHGRVYILRAGVLYTCHHVCGKYKDGNLFYVSTK